MLSIVKQEIQRLQKRIEVAKRRIAKHNRQEETVEIETPNDKKPKKKTKKVPEKSREIVAHEIEMMHRLQSVIEKMKATNTLVYDQTKSI